MQNLILNQIGFLDHPAISKQLKVCGDITKSDITDSDVTISNVTELSGFSWKTAISHHFAHQ